MTNFNQHCRTSFNIDSANLWFTGSYDHTVRLWDVRDKAAVDKKPVFKVDHGCPVEEVLVLPGNTLMLSAGGNTIKVRHLPVDMMICVVSNIHFDER